MFAYDFMRYAFIASTFIAITCGIVGIFVVARNLSFLAHTLSEIGFAGASFAVFAGITPLWGMLLFTALSSLGVGSLSARQDQRESSISAISALFIGLGILFLSLSKSTSRYATSILFGSIIGVSYDGVVNLIILSLLVLLVVAALFRPLAFDSFDHIGARANQVHTTLISALFLVLMAIAVSISSQVVGSMLVFILLTLPASSAKYLGKTIPLMMLWSVGIALFGVWMGIYLSYITNWPVTFFIATIEVIIYLIVFLWHRART